MILKKGKRRIIIYLVFLILFTTKIYFEIDNHFYESKIEESQNLVMKSKTTIEHKTLNVNDLEINYYISGKEHKNTILFLHPAFSDHSAFNQQIDFFTKNYKVITIDLIGHGLSKATKYCHC